MSVIECDVGDEETVHVLALLSLPEMGPRRLAAVREQLSARGAWRAISRWPAASVRARLPDANALRGNPERLYRLWAGAQAKIDPVAHWQHHRRRGVHILTPESVGYPSQLRADPEPPALLFATGELAAADVPSVAIVGTRRATAYGLGIAKEWSLQLATAGIAVVSGLASGIDASAHAGALAAVDGARPVAVVGSGLDVIYPAKNAALWSAVAQRGLLLSEAPLGCPPERWRFPARNRIMAALADVVVVVESHAHGGALITAELAAGIGRDVLAVPGSVRSPASIGTNRLISQGAGLAASVADVVTALALCGAEVRGPHALAPLGETASSPEPPHGATILAALGWEPATLDDLVGRTGYPLGLLCAGLDDLLRAGRVRQAGSAFIQVGES